jgi:lipopolysaccharide/colanic/teichoic acid biosynthesis glycosyltransferase
MANRLLRVSVVLDLLGLVGAAVAASVLAFQTPFPWHFRSDIWTMLGALAGGALIGLFVTTRYGGNGVPRPSYLRAIGLVGIALGVTAIGIVVTRAYWSRPYLFGTVGLWFVFAVGHRFFRRRRPWTEGLAVVTNEKVLIDHLRSAPHANVTAVLDPAGLVPEEPLPTGTTLAVDLRAVLSDDMARFVSSCSLAGYPMRSLVSAYEEHTGRLAIVHLLEGWEVTVPLSDRVPYVRTKRVLDTFLVLVVSPIALLLGLLIALAVRIDSRGPVIFRQRRIGLEGRPFTLYKFRTMRTQDDPQHPRFARRGDDRLTRVGRFLRLIRIDELPQLWNVVRGDLSLVGPRPEQGRFVERFAETIPFYTHRHLVRPGITGWAQVNYGYADSEADTIEKLSYDLYYVKHVSPWLDAEILGKSIWTVLSGFGAR